MSVTIDVPMAMLCLTVLALGFVIGVIFVTATSDYVRNLFYGWLDRRQTDNPDMYGEKWPPSE